MKMKMFFLASNYSLKQKNNIFFIISFSSISLSSTSNKVQWINEKRVTNITNQISKSTYVLHNLPKLENNRMLRKQVFTYHTLPDSRRKSRNPLKKGPLNNANNIFKV